MSLLANHVLLMVIYSILTGTFFALLWRKTPRERWKLFGQVAGGLFLGGLLLAWAMFPFPIR